MKKAIAMKWIKALRSGNYEQGTNGFLKEDDKYCCLGVLCHIQGFDIDAPIGDLTIEQMKVCDIQSPDGTLPKEYKDKVGCMTNTLAGLNDTGLSFKQIARIIEHNYEEL